MDITFTRATVDDTVALVRFMREYYSFDHLAFDEQVAREGLHKLLNNESFGRVWMIEMDHMPVGYVVLTFGFSLLFHGRDAWIDELYLDENYRGRGIGKSTLAFVENECRNLGVRAVHLEVFCGNQSAGAVYHKCGFAEHDSRLMTKWI